MWGYLSLKDETVFAEAMDVTDLRRTPFDRVENGYDPHQVAAFAAEALTWKRDLATTRTALAETLAELEHHIALATASHTAGESDVTAPLQPAPFQPTPFELPVTESEPEEADESPTLATGAVDDIPPSSEEQAFNVDPLDAIFEMTLEPAPDETDAEVLREQRVAAAAANLWKRRGVLTPQE